MSPQAAEADRRHEVRQAAHAWLRAGVIDTATLTAIEAAYPDDRVRLGRTLRALVFCFTTLGLVAAVFLVGAVLGVGDKGAGPLALAFGALLFVATEWQLGAGRRSQGRSEAATGCVALGCLFVGSLLLLHENLGLSSRAATPTAWATAALLLGVGALRFGVPLYAGGAALASFGLLTELSRTRLLFVLAALPLAVAGALV